MGNRGMGNRGMGNRGMGNRGGKEVFYRDPRVTWEGGKDQSPTRGMGVPRRG